MSRVDTELHRLLFVGQDDTATPLVYELFKRAIALHQTARVDAYLGAPPSNPQDVSIILKHLYLCAATRRKDIWLLIETPDGVVGPDVWRGHQIYPSETARGCLAWVHCSQKDAVALRSVLSDDEVWRLYGRMLLRITELKRRDRPLTMQRLSVLA
ncbi:MAG: hypothetical protein AB7P40_23970 [Chloroflexota bacterium]